MAVLTPIDLNSFELFMAQYMTHQLTAPVAPFHRAWCRALCDRSEQYVAIESTRGGGKTTWGAKGFGLYNICEGPDPEMQVVSRAGGSTGTATKIMAAIKRELEENDLLIHDYGIKRGSAWGQDHIQVKRADGMVVDFYSVGKHSSIRGSRGTVLIDDPQNAADCRSETVLMADEEWLLTDVLPVIIQDQRLIFIGTPISPLSLLSKVKQMPGWKVLSFPIEDPPHSGRSVWPEQYSDEFLAERLAMMGIDLYSSEYLCEPRVSGNPVFRPEWFRSYDPESAQFRRIRNEGLYIVTGMDCAESKSDQADYTFIVTLGITFGKTPEVYVLDARRHHWSTKEGAEQLFLVFDKFKQNKTVVESRVKGEHGDAMIEEIRTRETTYNKFVNLYPVRPTRDKVTRAMVVQSIVQEGRVFFNHHDPGQQALISELTMFTGDQNYHDDGVDAFVHALTDVKERGPSRGVSIVSALDESW